MKKFFISFVNWLSLFAILLSIAYDLNHDCIYRAFLVAFAAIFLYSGNVYRIYISNLFRIPNDTTNYYSVVGNTVYHKYDGATAKFSPGMNFAGAYIKPDGTLVSTYMIMMFGGLVGTSYYVATRITYEVYN